MVTSLSISDDLKTAFAARDFSTLNSIDDLRSWYFGPDVFTFIGTLSGRVKALSDTATPRLFEQSETNITRAWSEPELVLWLSQNVTYENHEFESFNTGLNRRCTLTVGGVEFIGEQLIGSLSQENADLEALAQAILELLNDENFDNYRA